MKKLKLIAIILSLTLLLTACVAGGTDSDASSGVSGASTPESIIESIVESIGDTSDYDSSDVESTISEQETSEDNTSQKETSQQETSQQETSQKETSQQETSQRETSQKETSKMENSQSETSEQDISEPNTSKETSEPTTSEPSTDEKNNKVAYIPLDDRPVNTDRVIYQALSGGLEILMPDADLYSTKLDGRGTNSNGTKYGDRNALVNWLKEVDDECDYFVISLDQILSGGLVSSRAMSSENLSFEYAAMDYIAELAKTNKVYLFDTVMRLASTVGYDGYSMNEYMALREYGKIVRKQLSGTELTVENIINGYKIGTNGAEISFGLSNTVINNYLRARARKLKLCDYIIKKTENVDNVYFFIGIDDSSPEITIQTNEINYIRKQLYDKGVIFAGTDELGMMAVARLNAERYNRNLKVSVKYFGGQENAAADAFDIGTLAENVNIHLQSLNANVITSGTPELEILVLTKPTNQGSFYNYVNSLVSRAKSNIKSNIPTVVIDASGFEGGLQRQMIYEVELSALLGYSNWNTVGNSIGIAVGQAFARAAYLLSGDTVTEISNKNFIKAMTFSYVKDISYIIDMNRYFNFGSLSYYLQNESAVNYNLKQAVMTRTGTLSATTILEILENGEIIVGLLPYKTSPVGKISLDNFNLPWYRTFEMRFEIDIK